VKDTVDDHQLWNICVEIRGGSSTTRDHPEVAVTKQQWRARLLAARTARPAAERARARALVTAHLLAALAGAPTTVCAYHALPTEPLAADLPDQLARAGMRVLVPVARPGEPLDWCEFGAGGELAPGLLGVLEPTGARLGPAAIRDADVVLVPALAVDPSGVRLGRGGGHYDRSLALLGGDGGSGPRPRLIAVVFDDELVEELPHRGHDIRVTDVLTPAGGLVHVAPGPRTGASSD
jgi:5-formyltetrahydrofolate cyclo-ligase